MARKKKVIDRVIVTDFAAEGKCIIKSEEHGIVFIPGSNIAPGDEVKILINRKKKAYSEGVVLEVLCQSKDRINPKCVHFGTCGGCKWQHIDYLTQQSQKQKQVAEQLNRIGGIEVDSMLPILSSSHIYHYRNKLEFSFSKSQWLTRAQISSGKTFDEGAFGFHASGRFDKVLSIQTCHLMDDRNNEIRNFVHKYAKESGLPFYDHIAHKGFWRTMMLRKNHLDEYMVCFQFAMPETERINSLLSELIDRFPYVKSCFYFINQKRNDSYFDLTPIHFSGVEFLLEEMDGLNFRVGPKSFFQTNYHQALNLYRKVKELAEVNEEDILYDLYTGTGTIAAYLARNCKKVVGIEYVEEAIHDAKINAEINGIENCTFYAGDMKSVFTMDLCKVEGLPNVLVVDPPRAGMDEPVIKQIIEVLPERIIYVSCNAATQARDVKLLLDYYEIDFIQPFDMFPHTHHVENIMRLQRKVKN